jgi:hypothetical protein
MINIDKLQISELRALVRQQPSLVTLPFDEMVDALVRSSLLAHCADAYPSVLVSDVVAPEVLTQTIESARARAAEIVRVMVSGKVVAREDQTLAFDRKRGGIF